MKKLTVLLVFVLGFSALVTAQSRVEERSFSVTKEDKIQLELRFGDTITIKSWDKNTVAFKAVIEINSGKLNEALELVYDQENGRLKIASDFNEAMLKKGKCEDCPGNEYSRYSWNDDGDSYVVCSKINYQIMMPRNAELDVESISGDIELVDLTGPIRAKSISGFVDLSWPSGRPADINIETVSGEAYTNLDDLQFENKKDHIPLVGYELQGKIGSGGPRISLESVSGNIYLRRSKS